MKPQTFSAPSAAPRETDPQLSLREIIARVIYDERPFTIATSGGVMAVLRETRSVEWDEAPDWYRDECFDFADAIAGRLLTVAREQAERPGGRLDDDQRAKC